MLCATIPWSWNLRPSDRESDLIAWYPEEYRTALLSMPTHYILRKVSREKFFPSFWCNHCLLDTWAPSSFCGSTDISQESHNSIPHTPRSWTAHMQHSIIGFAVSILKDLWFAHSAHKIFLTGPPQLNSFSGNSFTQLIFLAASQGTDKLLTAQFHFASLEGRGNFSSLSSRFRVYQGCLDNQGHLLTTVIHSEIPKAVWTLLSWKQWSKIIESEMTAGWRVLGWACSYLAQPYGWADRSGKTLRALQLTIPKLQGNQFLCQHGQSLTQISGCV